MKEIVDILKVQLSKKQLNIIQKKELRVLLEFNSICKKNNICYSLAGGTLIGAIRHGDFIPWDDDIDVYVLRSDFNRLRKICPKELSNDLFYQCNETDKDYFYPYDKIRINGTVFRSPYLSGRNIHHGIFIDIFPIDVIPNDSFLSNIQYFEYRFLRLILLSKFLNKNAFGFHKRLIMKLINSFTKFVKLSDVYQAEEKIAQRYNKYINSANYVRNLNSLGKDGKKETYPITYFKEYTLKKFHNNYLPVSKYYDQMLKQLYGDYMKLPPANKRCTTHDLVSLKL